MSKKDGGPAFPPVHDPDTHPSGMTLLDYFAAAALHSGLVARALADTPRPEGQTVGQQIAEIAYTIAGRMLAERAKDRP